MLGYIDRDIEYSVLATNSEELYGGFKKYEKEVYHGLYVNYSESRDVQKFISEYATQFLGESEHQRLTFTNEILYLFEYDVWGTARPYMRMGYVFGCIMIVIAVLVLINFLLNNIFSRKTEIGILRAMGAKQKDIIHIFFLEGMIILAVTLLGGFAFGYGAVTMVNGMIIESIGYPLTLIGFNFWACLELLAIGFIASLFALIMPFVKLNKMKPIDIIRK